MFALSATKTDVLPPPTIAGRFIRAKNRNRRCRSAPATFCYYSTKMKYCWRSVRRADCGGGLYCFPQFADEESLRQWLAQRQIAADNLTQLTAFRHTFSHFHLDIVPMWLPVSSFTGCMDEGNALWYNLAQPPSVGPGGSRGAFVTAVTHWRAGLARESIKRMIYEQNDFFVLSCNVKQKVRIFSCTPASWENASITRSPKKPGRSGSTSKPC